MPGFLCGGAQDLQQELWTGTVPSGDATQDLFDRGFKECFSTVWERTLFPVFSMLFRVSPAFLTSPLFEQEAKGNS